MRAVGYRQGMQYLAGELDEAEFRNKAITATRRLAKRQLTWLRNWPDLHQLTWGDAHSRAGLIREAISVRR
jgi:tRNA dimethylallyltransferase